MRFMPHIKHPSDTLIAQLTNNDGVNQVALVAVMKAGAAENVFGVNRYSLDPVKPHGECASGKRRLAAQRLRRRIDAPLN